MSNDADTRDAYHEVVVDLPNGQKLKGRPVMYAQAMKLLALREAFTLTGVGLTDYLTMFHALTGVPEDAAIFTDISLGEVLDATERFFFWRRPAPTAAPSSPPPPAPSPT